MSAGGFFGNAPVTFAPPITIPDFGEASDTNGRTMYPGFIRSTTSGTVSVVRLRFTGFTHTYPADVMVLLTKCDPIIQRARMGVMMAHCGGTSVNHVENINFTLQSGATALPRRTKIGDGGIYSPAAYDDTTSYYWWANDYLPGPPPRPPGDIYPVGFDDFIGAPAQGFWALWISDSHGLDAGSIGNIELLIDVA